MKVLILYDNSGPKYHRLFAPCVRMPGIELTVSRHLTEALLEWCDILFVNRAIGKVIGSIEDGINELRDTYKFKLIVDFDDHWELGKDHFLYHDYKREGKTETMLDYIKVADAVTVTHERLAEEVKPFNKNVHILPNSIPSWDQFLTPKEPDPLIRLFWAGSITHKEDIKLLARPLQLIKRNKVKFIMGGYTDGPDWDEMAKMFTTNSSYNTEVLRGLPVEHYYTMYSKCDIALIPLVETKFNTHKSNLKILEAANNGSPVIVSRVHPYLDFPDDLVNYVDLNNTWYSQINKLIKDPDLVKEQGQRLKEYCETRFNFDEINLKRKQLFNDTIEQGKVRVLQAEEAVG